MARKVPWTEQEIAKLSHGYHVDNLTCREIHERLLPNRSEDAIQLKLGNLRREQATQSKGFSVDMPPRLARETGPLLDHLRQEFERKAAHHKGKRHININIEKPGPYGLFFFGDAHLGDPGCDLGQLAAHMCMVRDNSDLYAVNMGDLSNNWVGRLQALYAHQTVTDDEERKLIQWLLKEIDWLFVILGNHDKWSPLAGHLCEEAGVAYASHGAKLYIKSLDSVEPCVVDAAHTHKGNSQYNPAHAQLVQNYRGNNADIIIGAHIHQGGYTIRGNGISEKIGHCIRLGAYKRYDDFADRLGFEPDMIGPACICVVDPSKTGVGFVTTFIDVDEGLEFLKMKRELFRRKAAA